MSRKYRIGFIGCGNMGRSMLRGFLKSRFASKQDICVSVSHVESAKRINRETGCFTCRDNTLVAEECDIIILAVKPGVLSSVLAEIRPLITADQLIISVVAGKTIQSIEEGLMSIEVAGRLKVVRAMPNTPAMVGESMSAICVNRNMKDRDVDLVIDMFDCFGRTVIAEEHEMDVITGLSGSSPAFIYMLMEAMADAGVKYGLPREASYLFVSQTVMGAAKMLRDTGMHPGQLKDAVCSPGGTTIAGVRALEKAGLRDAIISGIEASVEKARELSGNKTQQ